MERLSRLTALIASLTALAACAPAAGSAHPSPPPAEATETTIRVDNRNDRDVVVYLVGSGIRHRVGMVGPLSSRRFEISAPALRTSTQVRVLLAPFASSQAPHATELVSLRPGEQLDLRIGDPLVLSAVAVR